MARLDDRGGRDAAGRGPYHRPGADLVALRELGDWSLGDGEPDIRGWEVKTVGGRAIGTVRDLLVDRTAGEVVLLDIDVDASDRRARAPIRSVQIDRSARVLRMDSADLLMDDGAPDFRSDSDIPRDAAAPPDRAVARPVATDATRTPRPGPVPDTGEPSVHRLADGSLEETVVERRPVVFEEVVVRRRVVDPDVVNPEGLPDEPQRQDHRAD